MRNRTIIVTADDQTECRLDHVRVSMNARNRDRVLVRIEGVDGATGNRHVVSHIAASVKDAASWIEDHVRMGVAVPDSELPF